MSTVGRKGIYKSVSSPARIVFLSYRSALGAGGSEVSAIGNCTQLKCLFFVFNYLHVPLTL